MGLGAQGQPAFCVPVPHGLGRKFWRQHFQYLQGEEVFEKEKAGGQLDIALEHEEPKSSNALFWVGIFVASFCLQGMLLF